MTLYSEAAEWIERYEDANPDMIKAYVRKSAILSHIHHLAALIQMTDKDAVFQIDVLTTDRSYIEHEEQFDLDHLKEAVEFAWKYDQMGRVIEINLHYILLRNE